MKSDTNIDSELLGIITTLSSKSSEEKKFILLSIKTAWNLDAIKATFQHYIQANDYSEEFSNILIEWFNVNGYHVLANNKIPSLQQKDTVSHLLAIIRKLKEKTGTESLQNILELTLIRNSRMNRISQFPSYGKLLTDGIITRFKSTGRKALSFRLLDFPIDITGKLLTHMFTDLLAVINHSEFNNCCWMKNDRKLAPTILRVIDFYNFICCQLSTEILESTDERIRAKYIVQAITLASGALKLNNFDLLSAIIVALNSGPISRLKKTWDLISKKKILLFDSLNEIVTPLSNYVNYRTRVNQLIDEKIQFIPMLAVVLKDLAANDVKPTYSNETEKAHNLDKLVSFGKIILPIYQLQTSLPTVEEKKISHSIENLELLKSVVNALPLSDDCLLHLSYEREKPKDLSLLFELTDEENSTSFTSLTLSEKTKILRLSAMKNPAQWNSTDVRVNLEAWGFSSDICDSLVPDEIPNGEALLLFTPSKNTIPILGMRKHFQRKVKELMHYQLLLNTYGSACLPNSSPSDIKDWTNEEVAVWIKNTKFSKYEPNFSNITGSKLLLLTDQELQTLGVAALGHRKGLLREINRLKPNLGTRLSLAPATNNNRTSVNYGTRARSNSHLTSFPINYVHSF